MTSAALFERQRHGPWLTSGRDVQWRMTEIDGEHLVEFQCTRSLSDWLHNILFPPERVWHHRDNDNGFWAHAGFISLWDSVRDDVVKVVEATVLTRSEPTFFHVVGYSQGGAIAILAAEELRLLGYAVELTTFASPRPVWGYASDKVFTRLAGTHYRVRGDIVPMLPLAIMGYYRGGCDHRIGRPSPLSFKNHEPEAYAKALAT